MGDRSLVPNWKRSNLLSLADYHNGAAFNPSHWGDEGLPIIRIEQINDPSAPTDFYEGPLAAQNKVTTGDLIFSWSATLKVVIWRNGDGALNQHLFKVVPKNGTNKTFLKYVLEQNMESISSGSQGSTMKHITRGELQRFRVELPEQEVEQRRIAEILSTLDEAIEQTEALIAKHQQIKAGLMHDLFTRGVTSDGHLRPTREQAPDLYKPSPLGWIPKEWDVKRCDSEFVIDSGITLGPHRRPNKTPHPYLRVGNVYRDRIVLDDVTQLEATLEEVEAERLKRYDLLVVEGHANRNEIGRCAMVFNDAEGMLFQNHLFRLRAVRLDPRYSLLWLNSPRAQHYWDSMCSTSSGLNTINRRLLGAMPILIPLQKEQRLISDAVFSCREEESKNAAYLAKLRQQKHGLMHDLLTGRVRVIV